MTDAIDDTPVARNVYLHEQIDIVGDGAMRYMEHVVGFDTAGADGSTGAAGRGIELVGTWYTMGSTGRWPQVVNLWECVDGWTGWRRLMESTNLRRTQDPELEEWWRDALRSRSGGTDRLLGAAPDCPSRAELRDSGVTGSVFVHEVSQVRPGTALLYLSAVAEEWQPVLAEYDHQLVGLYEVLLTDSEVVTIWATDPAGHEALMRASDAGTDEGIRRWASRRRELTTCWREELMTPLPGTLLSRGDTL